MKKIYSIIKPTIFVTGLALALTGCAGTLSKIKDETIDTFTTTPEDITGDAKYYPENLSVYLNTHNLRCGEQIKENNSTIILPCYQQNGGEETVDEARENMLRLSGIRSDVNEGRYKCPLVKEIFDRVGKNDSLEIRSKVLKCFSIN